RRLTSTVVRCATDGRRRAWPRRRMPGMVESGVSGVTTLLGDRGFWIAFGVATAGAALPVVLRRAGRHGALGSGLGIGAVLVAVPLAVRLDRRLPRLGFLVLGISAGGLYACVPDTEPARPLLGALAPVALVVLLALGGRVKAHPGAVGALAALVVWGAAIGGP